MWARVKGKIETALLQMPFRPVYTFPLWLHPALHGIRTKTKWHGTF